MHSKVNILLLKIFFLALPFILLFTWIEYQTRQLPNSYSLKKSNFERIHDSVRILVLGSSHALKGINPDLFSCKGFNFSNSSQSLDFDAYIYHEFNSHMPSLKAVILEISYFSFFYTLGDSPEDWRQYFYYHHYGIHPSGLDLSDPRAFFYTTLYTKGFINDLVFGKLECKKEFGDIQSNGWEKTSCISDPSAISDQGGQARASLHKSLMHESRASFILGRLEGLLSRLKQDNIAIYLVTTPVFSTYANHLDPEIIKRNHDIISRLQGKYQVSYFDYASDPRFQKDDFYDNDHLNTRGAEKFSRILEEDFLKKICKD